MMSHVIRKLSLLVASTTLPTAAFAAEGGSLLANWREEIAMPVRARITEIAAEAPFFLSQADSTLRGASPDGTLSWYLSVLVLVAVFGAVGVAVAQWIMRWGRSHFTYMFNPTPKDRAEKITYLLLRSTLMFVGVFVFYCIASILWVAFGIDHPAASATQATVYGVAATIWALRVVFRNILVPDAPSHRMLRISDDDANGLYRSLTIQVVISGISAGLCMWMGELGLSPYPHALLLIVAAGLVAALLSWVTISYRKAIATMAFGPEEDRRHPGLIFIAKTWHIFIVLYWVLAWASSAVRIMIGLPAAVGLIAGPIAILFLALAAYGVLLWIIDRFTDHHEQTTADEVVDDEEESSDIVVVPHNENDGSLRRTFKELAERMASVLVWFGAGWGILSIWGVDLASDESWLVRAGDVLFILFLGYFGYQATKAAIDRKIESEGGFEMGEPGDEGGGGSATRLATLLPLFRNFVLVTLVVLAGMIVLSELGVDIAPLFAGAGVIGLAVGFGAQTLIRDIFSGAFFLVDDAFRLGEYINVEGTRGTVEKISVRSMQLRHHLGALHTIPFGEIKQLTNHSRDWAMMKLELRVTYDTDVDKVRKLVKKLGNELLEDPEIGEKFVQPLKSQGVLRMEDSAMIIRVKYMTRPGDQFVIRKQVFARIRELFAKEGIKFAHREVTVRVASGSEDESAPALTPQLAGAALPAIEAAQHPNPLPATR